MAMNDQHWDPPLWTMKNQITHNNLTQQVCLYPDWGNVGPSLRHTTGKVQDNTQQSNSQKACEFTNIKDIMKKFPLEVTHKFAYPLVTPKNFTGTKTRDKTQIGRGNCIDVMKLAGQSYVVYSAGKDKSESESAVHVCKVTPGIYHTSKDSGSCMDYLQLQETHSPATDSDVHQVLAREVSGEGFVLLRSKNNIDVITINQQWEWNWEKPKHEDLPKDTFTTDADLSHSIPGLWVLAFANGTVVSNDSERTVATWKADFHQKKKVCQYICSFGRHPLHVTVGNANSIWSCDTRAPPPHLPKKDTSGLKLLFDLNKVKKNLPTDTDICTFKQVYEFPFLYVVTGETVYVIDDRYAKMPVMNWKHMMLNRPCFTSSQKIRETEFLLLANGIEKKVCGIAHEFVADRYNAMCRGISIPKYFQIGQNTENFAHREGIWFSHQVEERLRGAWEGVTSLVHPSNQSKMCILSLYKNGDVFLQCLQHTEEEPLCDTQVPIRDTEGKIILQKWEEEISGFPSSHLSSTLKAMNTTSLCHLIQERIMERRNRKVKESQKKYYPDGKKQNCWHVNKVVQNLKYSKTKFTLKWQSILSGQYKSDLSPELCSASPTKSKTRGSDGAINVFHTRYTDFFKPEIMEQCLKQLSTNMSSKLLTTWQATPSTSTSSTAFYTAPLNVDRLSGPPARLTVDQECTPAIPCLMDDSDVVLDIGLDEPSITQTPTTDSQEKVVTQRKSISKKKKIRVDGF